jgi:endonuclease-3 related protein
MAKRLEHLYKKLLAAYGHQHWWPADTPYEVVVGAVLTQNTNWKNVEKAIANLKKEGALNEKAILEMDIRKLQRLVKPSGFYKQKAERLKLVTRKWVELKDADLSSRQLRSEWLSVKGIGKETADSILLYAMDRPFFVIDAYTRRFCKRHLKKEFREYDDYRWFFEKNLPRNIKLYKEYHALIVEWGKDFRPQKFS